MPIFKVQTPSGEIIKIEAPEGATESDALAFAQSTYKPKQSVSDIESLGRGAYQSASLGFGNNIQALGGAAVGSVADLLMGNKLEPISRYNEALDLTRKNEALAQEQNPKYYLGGQIGGAIGTGILSGTTQTGKALANSLGSGQILGKQLGLLGQGIKGAGAASSTGSIAAFGSGEGGVENRLKAAEQAVLPSAVLGLAAPFAISGISKAFSPIANNVGDFVTRQIAKGTGEIQQTNLSPALKKVADRLKADYPDPIEYQKALNSFLAKDKSLIEMGGERLKNLGEGATVYPSGAAKATEFFTDKVGDVPEKFKTTLTKVISPHVNYNDTLDAVVDNGRKQAKPLYDRFYKSTKSIQTPVIDRVLASPEGKLALGDAVKNIQNELLNPAVANKELSEVARELGAIESGGVAAGLKPRTLDYVKRSMDKTIRAAYRGGDEQLGGRITNLKNILVKELDNADKTGAYAKARAVSGDYLSSEKAMENGLNFFNEDREIVARTWKEFGKVEKDAYKVGVLKAAREVIDRRASEGANITRKFEVPVNREKLKTILSPKEYTKLQSEIKAADNLYKLKNQFLGNSRTALRQQAAMEFDNEGQQILMDLGTKGITRTAIDTLARKAAQQFDGLNDKLAGQVSDIIYETNPKVKYQIVKRLLNESKYSTGIRQTQAAQQLQLYYNLTDTISKNAKALAPAYAPLTGVNDVRN
jgi:hypothetical protein